MTRRCEVHRLGLLSYEQAWALQKRFAADIAAGARRDSLLLLEHSPTYTLGRSGKREHLLLSAEELAERGTPVHWVDRGGDITYHGPGQLVGYPLLNLGRPDAANGHLPKADYVGYLRQLEAVLVRTLARFGVVSGQMPGLTGVWVQPDVASRCPHCPPAAKKLPSKIASIGVKVDRNGISQHGFALNIAPDMAAFEGIVACGLQDYPAIALADLLYEEPAMSVVMDRLVETFGQVFDFEMRPIRELSPSSTP